MLPAKPHVLKSRFHRALIVIPTLLSLRHAKDFKNKLVSLLFGKTTRIL